MTITTDIAAQDAHTTPRKHRPAVGRMWVARLVAAAVFVSLWQLFYDRGWINPLFFGSPSGIFEFLRHGLFQSTALWDDIFTTSFHTLLAFLLGAVSGIVVGLLFSTWPPVGRFFSPLVSGLNAIPRIALAPMFILWFGLGSTSSIAVGVSLTFFILLSSTQAAVESISPDIVTLVRTLGGSRWSNFLRVTLPSSIPTVFSGLRLGLVYALLGVVSAEIIGAPSGLGEQLSYLSNTLQVNGVFAILIILALLGSAAAGGMSALERHLMRWR